jgi:hypothetical protein
MDTREPARISDGELDRWNTNNARVMATGLATYLNRSLPVFTVTMTGQLFNISYQGNTVSLPVGFTSEELNLQIDRLKAMPPALR